MRENVINKNSTDEGRIKKNRMDEVAVLIPCYNESKTIEKVVTDFRRELPDAVIYVYDNNSTDNTVEIAKQAGAVVRHEYQQGKGNVVRRMFQEIDANCYILVDGDDTYPCLTFIGIFLEAGLKPLCNGSFRQLPMLPF